MRPWRSSTEIRHEASVRRQLTTIDALPRRTALRALIPMRGFVRSIADGGGGGGGGGGAAGGGGAGAGGGGEQAA